MNDSLFSCFAKVLFLLLASLIVHGAEPGHGKFQFEENESSIAIHEGKNRVLVYNFGAITNANFPKAEPHSAYIHPLYGLDGEVLTGDFPADHVYHRGLYWAWPHIKVGGDEYDLWSLRGIRNEFERWVERTATDKGALLAIENSWRAGGKQVMREEVRIRVHPATGAGRSIDLELSWTPIEEPVTLWGAPGKRYGGLTFRFGKRSETIITVPSGRTKDDLLMTRLPWADLTGDMAGDRLSGAAVFVHPEHPDFPPEWMTRHYGVLAVGWPGVKAQKLEPGKTIICRYRIWVHRAVLDAGEIQKLYGDYREEVRKY